MATTFRRHALIDFGIARTADETGLTNTGATIGTWAYMAPERFNTSDIEPSSDIYALACVLFQCLTGTLPYPGQTLQEIAAGHMFGLPPKASTQHRTLPSAIDNVISTGLAKNPAHRYSTTVELARDARNAITTTPQSARATDQLIERLQPGVLPSAPTQNRSQADLPSGAPLRPAAGTAAPHPANPPTITDNSRAASHPAQPQTRPANSPLASRDPTRPGQSSRRRLIGGGAAAAAALVLGPSAVWWMTRSADPGLPTNAEGSAAEGSGLASGRLRITNWPLYVSDGFVAAFQTASGVTVDYQENLNDNEQWFAKIKEPMSRKQDIGADLAIPTTFMASRLHNLGWLNDFNQSNIPNLKNLRSDLLNAKVDPGCKFSAPYMSGMVGIGYNRAATGRDIYTIDDMWDPAFKGRVSLFSDARAMIRTCGWFSAR